MARRKRIEIGDGIMVAFDHRARGEESPYWQGRLMKEGKVVGTFSNHGRGGATIIEPPAMVDALRAVVDKAEPQVGPMLAEREHVAILYADIALHEPGCVYVTLKQVVREFALMAPSPR
jgi:hypothetical protein